MVLHEEVLNLKFEVVVGLQVVVLLKVHADNIHLMHGGFAAFVLRSLLVFAMTVSVGFETSEQILEFVVRARVLSFGLGAGGFERVTGLFLRRLDILGHVDVADFLVLG